MITLNIEGFTVTSDINEAAPYTRMYEANDLISFEQEIYVLVMDVIEQMIIGGKTAAQFFYDNGRGYRNRSLEPFNWRETKTAVKIRYTGAQGGDEYEITILK